MFAGLRVVLVAKFNQRYHRTGGAIAGALEALGCEVVRCEERTRGLDRVLVRSIRRRLIATVRRHRPDLILISAGFDAHKDDPLANIELTESSFSLMTSMLMDVAEKHSHNRIVSVLEGGYHLQALAYSAEAHIRELMKVAT